MKCAVHSDADATGYCRNCGKPMCPSCIRPVRDVLYCEDCLATILGHPAPAQAFPAGVAAQPPVAALPPAAPAANGPNPVLAFFLGFLPGLGAFYNEQYGKGMIHLAIFLVLFIIGVNGSMSGGAEAALWICLGVLYFYMPIDAARTAQARRSGQTLSDPLDHIARNRPIGPIVLIGAGILLLLNNFDWFPWYRISQFFFPAILIGVGIIMFRNRLDRRP
ncbi:MAG TPA: B-box zinc finger protein [Candidatus Acidoferrum sp.]|nr:B-box zinc finger protein [Candidatus Acidoferrum sp.]